MLYLLAIVLPPLAVLLAGKPTKVPTSIILTLLVWLPGIVHAWITINRANADRRQKKFIQAMGKMQARPS